MGPTIYSYRECKEVATFTPLSNHDYEVLLTSSDKDCKLSLFEIKTEAGYSKRVEAKFDDDKPTCSP